MSALNRWYVNFEGNERIDIPDFLTMIQRVIADSNLQMKMFWSDAVGSSVLKNFVEGPRSPNVFTILVDIPRSFYDDFQEWIYVEADPPATVVSLPTVQGTTNYVEVRIATSKDLPQTRAFWDTEIGVNGEEFFDIINTRLRYDEFFRINQTGFTGGIWVPLFTVVVDGGGNVTSATPAWDFFWEPGAYTLPSVRSTVYTDNTVTNFKEWLALLNAVIAESKGTVDMVDTPWTTDKTLRELQNALIYGGGNITFEGSFGADNLDWSAAINILIAGRTNAYVVDPDTIALLDGDVAYVTIPTTDTPSGSLAVSVDTADAVPIAPGTLGQSPGVLVLFWRKGNIVYGAMGLPILAQNETAVQGEALDQAVRVRLGLTSETTFQAYTSTNYINSADTYPEAISNLDTVINQILSQISIIPHPTLTNRVIITGSDKILLDGSVLGMEMDNLLVDFDGAEIDFQTGTVYEEDGTTPLGINFTPNVPGAGLWRWYAINIIAATISLQNKLTIQMIVTPSGSTGATQATAPRATFTKEPKVGQVAVTSTDGVNVDPIDYANIVNVDTGNSAGGGGDPSNFLLKPAGENLVENDLVYISPGSANGDTGRTLGELYKVDAGNVNSALAAIRSQAVGFVTGAYTTGQTAEVQRGGTRGSFAGLIEGRQYYADPAVIGGITNAKPTTVGQYIVPVGLADSATEILLNPSMGSDAYLIVPMSSGSWPTTFVSDEAELTSALAALDGFGGVICMAVGFTISSALNVPAGVLLVSKYGGFALTMASGGSLTLAERAEVRDIKIISSAAGTLISMPNTRSIVRNVFFEVDNSVATTCISVSGSFNRILECSFFGVVGVGPATGIDYTGGVENLDRDSLFA